MIPHRPRSSSPSTIRVYHAATAKSGSIPVPACSRCGTSARATAPSFTTASTPPGASRPNGLSASRPARTCSWAPRGSAWFSNWTEKANPRPTGRHFVMHPSWRQPQPPGFPDPDRANHVAETPVHPVGCDSALGTQHERSVRIWVRKVRPEAACKAACQAASKADGATSACRCRRATTRTTPPRTSRSWRGWSRSASAPACISAAPTRPRCIIWRRKSSTTRWTRRWPAMPASSRSRWRRATG